MLVIRMQRVGRKGHAQFRVVVQDSRRTPTSGKIVAALGSYDPHAKTSILDKEKASFYLEHGAQPSPRVIRLLTSQGVKLPDWVVTAEKKTGKLRNPEKLRRNRPPEEKQPEAPAAEEAPVEEVAPDEEVAEAVEAPTKEVTEDVETPAEEPVAENALAEEPAAEETTEEASKAETAEEAPADQPEKK